MCKPNNTDYEKYEQVDLSFGKHKDGKFVELCQVHYEHGIYDEDTGEFTSNNINRMIRLIWIKTLSLSVESWGLFHQTLYNIFDFVYYIYVLRMLYNCAVYIR